MIIGLNGEISSGKDTVASIIQYLTWNPNNNSTHMDLNSWLKNVRSEVKVINSGWDNKKFASKLKDIVCILIGCTREQLEDQEFKNKELSEEWKVYSYNIIGEYQEVVKTVIFTEEQPTHYYKIGEVGYYMKFIKSYILTPRLLMQLIGTECFRNIIHPNTWVNSLFSEYKLKTSYPNLIEWKGVITEGYLDKYKEEHYPNWIISDLRFPNEYQAIKDRQGITIKIIRYPRKTSKEWSEIYFDVKILDPDGWNRDYRFNYEWNEELITLEKYTKKVFASTISCKLKIDLILYFKDKTIKHESETALNNHKFDYTIYNNGTIEQLFESVKEILIKEKII